MKHEQKKKMNKSKVQPITHDEWYRELFNYTSVVPEGAMSVAEIAEKMQMGEDNVRRLMQKKVGEGILEMVKVSINGKLRNYYRPIKK